jgi:hypothetical protein
MNREELAPPPRRGVRYGSKPVNLHPSRCFLVYPQERTQPYPGLIGATDGRLNATVGDNRTLDQFSDAELSAILRRRVGVVPVENDEERPEGGTLN